MTVVTVNWNSVPYLKVLTEAVRRFSDGVRLLVVDNASWDGTRSFLSAQRDVKTVRLPWNMGHPTALDIGFLLSDTEYVVALDVDAFPIREDWLDRLLEPLVQGATISGAHLNREYVHPCCLAIRRDRFVRMRHTFRGRYVPRRLEDGVLLDAHGDVGEDMAAFDGGPLHFLEPTRRFGPGDVGTVFGDVVYHNFYSTRFAAEGPDARLDGGVASDDASSAWDRAIGEFLGLHPEQEL